MNTNIEVLRELDELVEAARLLGVTQAKKLFGCHTDEDRRFERAMYESIDKHRAALLDWEAKQPAPQQPAAWDGPDAQAAEIEALRAEVALERNLKADAIHACALANIRAELLEDALRQIAEWPDGGNRYGQENIKRFAKAAIDHAVEWRGGDE